MSLSNNDIQRLLAASGRYRGALDGVLGPASSAAVQALLHGITDDLPRGWDAWPLQRKAVAAAQAILKACGLESGALDGLNGAQTDHAFSLWAHHQRHGTPAPTWRPEDNYDVLKHAPQSPWGTQRDVAERFGKAGGPRCTAGTVKLPFKMKLAWDPKTTLMSFKCHEDVAASATRVYEQIADTFSQKEIEENGFNLFGGCYSYRQKRGGSSLSMHAYGIAIDHDPERNQLKWNKDRAHLAQEVCKPFWAAWEAEGWTSLGRRHNFDWMHVQATSV